MPPPSAAGRGRAAHLKGRDDRQGKDRQRGEDRRRQLAAFAVLNQDPVEGDDAGAESSQKQPASMTQLT
ncbi:MAG: hypothetical protein ABW065_00425 [Solirubrobacterales bacterium]